MQKYFSVLSVKVVNYTTTIPRGRQRMGIKPDVCAATSTSSTCYIRSHWTKRCDLITTCLSKQATGLSMRKYIIHPGYLRCYTIVILPYCVLSWELTRERGIWGVWFIIMQINTAGPAVPYAKNVYVFVCVCCQNTFINLISRALKKLQSWIISVHVQE